ncbi:MAG: biotin/lipoyl-containing protein, partial [Brevundimonas sp.]
PAAGGGGGGPAPPPPPPPESSVRIDTGVEAGGEVSQFYDPMIAKLIVHEPSREAAAARLARACGEVEVWPIKTNAGFLKRCLEHPRFVGGDVDTGLIAAESEALEWRADASVEAAALALAAENEWHSRVFYRGADRAGPFEGLPGSTYGFRLNAGPRATYAIRMGGRKLARGVLADGGEPMWRIGDLTAEVQGQTVRVDGRAFGWAYGEGDEDILFADGEAIPVRWRGPIADRGAAGGASDGALRAPMPGKIVAAPLRAGDAVAKGQPVVVLEAMKMEHALTAPFDGVVETLSVAVGDQATEGAVLAVVKAAA